MVVCFAILVNSIDDRIDRNTYRLDTVEKAIDDEHEYVKEVFNQIREDLKYIRDRIDEDK